MAEPLKIDYSKIIDSSGSKMDLKSGMDMGSLKRLDSLSNGDTTLQHKSSRSALPRQHSRLSLTSSFENLKFSQKSAAPAGLRDTSPVITLEELEKEDPDKELVISLDELQGVDV